MKHSQPFGRYWPGNQILGIEQAGTTVGFKAGEHGKLDPPEMAQSALSGFFANTANNLVTLTLNIGTAIPGENNIFCSMQGVSDFVVEHATGGDYTTTNAGVTNHMAANVGNSLKVTIGIFPIGG